MNAPKPMIGTEWLPADWIVVDVPGVPVHVVAGDKLLWPGEAIALRDLLTTASRPEVRGRAA